MSVSVKSSGGEGSGVIKTRVVGGQSISFVWTAGHVVESLRSVEEIIDSNGTKRQAVKFADAAIVREESQGGRRVGESKMDVKVVRFSKEEDLALLQVRKQNYTSASVTFCLDPQIPPIGTRLLHVGSLLGQMGANSMTSGIQSQIGRVRDQKEFEQSTVTAFPGSSGGGVYLENGAYVGMLVQGAGEQFNLYVPVRRMLRWAKRANVEWAINDDVPAPSELDLEHLPVEDAGGRFPVSGAQPSPSPAPVPAKPAVREPTTLLFVR